MIRNQIRFPLILSFWNSLLCFLPLRWYLYHLSCPYTQLHRTIYKTDLEGDLFLSLWTDTRFYSQLSRVPWMVALSDQTTDNRASRLLEVCEEWYCAVCKQNTLWKMLLFFVILLGEIRRRMGVWEDVSRHGGDCVAYWLVSTMNKAYGWIYGDVVYNWPGQLWCGL